MVEEIVLVDDAGRPIGRAPKLQTHTDHTPLHLGFSCYLFNKNGQFLLTQRAKSKKVWPGVWTNSVCGHPAPEEPVEAAVKRRAAYELGLPNIKSLKLVLADYRYQTPPYNGIVENEVCPVFIGWIDEEPKPNPDEVEAYKWVGWAKIDGLIRQEPGVYSYWFKDQLPKLRPKLGSVPGLTTG